MPATSISLNDRQYGILRAYCTTHGVKTSRLIGNLIEKHLKPVQVRKCFDCDNNLEEGQELLCGDCTEAKLKKLQQLQGDEEE
jgi:hypothetical protein